MTGRARAARPSPDAAKVAKLRALDDQPVAQTKAAVALLAAARTPDAARAALAVLTARPPADLRALLLARYAQCDEDGSRRDPAGPIRIQLLEALRPLVLPEDTPLLERAATTYEYLYGEAAGDLRAAGLLALHVADDRLAAYHCVRLLVDEHTSGMSGEPALTAARILASIGQTLPLYAYVTQATATVADVVAECLRGLATLPPSLLPAIVARYRDSDDEIVLLGLFDLLLAHETAATHTDFIFDFLRDTPFRNIYRVLVSTLIAGRDEAIVARVATLAEREPDAAKRAILRDALALR